MRNLSGATLLTALAVVGLDQTTTQATPSTRPADWYIDPASGAATWVEPSEASLPNDATGELIRYGKKIATETYKYVGPDTKQPYQKSTLACTNCHIDGGTAALASTWAVSALKYGEGDYTGRFNLVFDLGTRIDLCMINAMVGKSLPRDSREMQALMAYMRWLSTGLKVKDWKKVVGTGFQSVELLDRAADPKRGKQVYADRCAACHGDSGAGAVDAVTKTVIYPPLWGRSSFGDTAGMGRLATGVKFIKANMPYGWANATDRSRQLSDEDAWDVTAYVIYQDRLPGMVDPKNEWSGYGPDCMPNWMIKPPDARYAPYYPRVKPDGTLTGDLSFPAKYSVDRHRYGPYKEMLAEQKALQAAYKKSPRVSPNCSNAPTPQPDH